MLWRREKAVSCLLWCELRSSSPQRGILSYAGPYTRTTLIRVYNEQGTIHTEFSFSEFINASQPQNFSPAKWYINYSSFAKAAQCVFRQQQYQLTPSAQSVSPLQPQEMPLLTFYFNSLSIAAIPCAVPSVVTAMNCAFAQVIYLFRATVTINSNYCPKVQQATGGSL